MNHAFTKYPLPPSLSLSLFIFLSLLTDFENVDKAGLLVFFCVFCTLDFLCEKSKTDDCQHSESKAKHTRSWNMNAFYLDKTKQCANCQKVYICWKCTLFCLKVSPKKVLYFNFLCKNFACWLALSEQSHVSSCYSFAQSVSMFTSDIMWSCHHQHIYHHLYHGNKPGHKSQIVHNAYTNVKSLFYCLLKSNMLDTMQLYFLHFILLLAYVLFC